jgi:branched-chain amino acid transport system substrate-binding protein
MRFRSKSLFFVGLSVLTLGTMPASAQAPFKIGAPVSTTGRYVAYGAQAKNGIEMAIETWKKVRGDKVAGRPIEVLFRDTQSNNSITVSLMNGFIQTDKVDVIIGPDGSNAAAAAVPPWKKLDDRPIWIMPGGSSDVIEKEVGPDPYFFHTYAWSYYYHDSNMKAFKALVGPGKKVALIYSDGAYGRAHVDDARRYIKEAGYDLVADELVREGSADFNSTLTKIRVRRPDILYVAVQTNDAIQLTKQIQAARLNVPYLIGTAQAQLPEWQNAVGDSQACWTGVTTWVPGLSYPADKKEPKLFPSAADWEKAWQEKFKAVPEFLEVGYYASTILALLAVEATKSADREVLRKWLEEQQYQTPVGDSKFVKSRIALHQAFGEMVVFQRQKKADGTFEGVLVYPPQIATGKLQPCTQ